MTPTPISHRFVDDVLLCLRASGHDPAPLLAQLGLREPLSEPITNALFGQLWRMIADTMQDEFFGLATRPMRPGSFVLLCHSVLHTRTLQQALRRALLFLSVVLDEPRGKLQVVEGEARIALVGTRFRSAFAYRTFWLVLMGVTSWLVGRRIPLRGLDFACPAPEHRQEYRQFFGAPVRFDAAVTSLQFDAAYLTLPVIRDEEALQSFLREVPANILVRFRQDRGTAITVRALLAALPPSDWPGFDALAQKLNRAPATLRRQLRADGQSYMAIKDELRSARAQQMLAENRLSVAEISSALGYSEPSAFFRAYHRWTGHSPRQQGRPLGRIGTGR